MNASPDFEAANRRTYSRKGVVSSYVLDGLLPAEVRLFDAYKDDIIGKRVLDIGVGGGRTTAALLGMADHYAAVDYASGSVDIVKRRFGLDSVYCADAQAMPMFDDATFDFILFSFNGIDYVDDEGRYRILGEIHRLLAPGGLFMFSAHNLDLRSAGVVPWRRRWEMSPRFGKACARALLFTHRRRRARAREIRTPDYALLNDEAHNYALVTYYAARDGQLRQLERTGFVDVCTFDEQGDAIAKKDDTSHWIYYVARK